MAAWSHSLLCNKTPVYTVRFWASQAPVTTAFLLPVRFCIISTDSTFVKWYAAGYAAGNVSKKKLCRGFINYYKMNAHMLRLPAEWSRGVKQSSSGGKKKTSWHVSVSVINEEYTGRSRISTLTRGTKWTGVMMLTMKWLRCGNAN